jgi:hypothetical protein
VGAAGGEGHQPDTPGPAPLSRARRLVTIALAVGVLGVVLAAGAFSVQLDTTAGNTYQNLAASQPIVWNFAA